MAQKTSVLQTFVHKSVKRWQLDKLYQQFFKDTEQTVFWATLLFCVASSIIPSNKIFFIIATVYVLSLVLITQSVAKAFLYAFLPLTMILIGQVYITTVIPFQALKKTVGYEGRQFYFRFSPIFVLQLTAIALLVMEAIRRRGRLGLDITHLFVFGCMLFRIISAVYTEHYPVYSLTIMIGLFGVVSWVVLTQLLLTSVPRAVMIHLIKTFLLVIILMSTVQSAVAVSQYLKKSTLNIRIEQSTTIPNFGAGADENALSFRPIGLQTHANELANSSLTLLFSGAVLMTWLRAQKKGLPWWMELFFIGQLLIVILICLSRAAYISVGVGAIFFFVTQRKTSLQVLHFLQNQLRPFIILLVALAIYLVPVVTERLLYTFNSFGAGGGLTTRQELEKLSLQLFREQPWLGVGPGMFIPAAYKQSPLGFIQYFPENVHNAFILHVVESGSLATLCILAFWYFFIRKVIKSSLSTLTKSVIGAGMLSIIIMMLLHPFDNFLTFFLLVSWIIVYIQDNQRYAKP